MMKKQLVALGILVSGLLVAGSTSPKAAMEAARVANADFVFFADNKAGKETPISKQLERYGEEVEKTASAEELAMKRQVEELMEAVGITEESIETMFASACIRSYTKDAEGNVSFPALLAMSTDKPLELEKIKAVAEAKAQEKGQAISLKMKTYKGIPMMGCELSAEMLAATAGDPLAKMREGLFKLANNSCLATVAEGKVLFVGEEKNVQGAIDRMLAGEKKELTGEMQKARGMVPAGSQSYVLFAMPNMFRQKIDQELAKVQQQNPMAAGPLSALAAMNCIIGYTRLNDKMNMGVNMDFMNETASQQMKMTVDMMVMGMVKMWVMQAVGRPIDFLDSLKAEQKEKQVEISFAMNLDDIKALKEATEKMQQGGGMMGPGMGAPQGIPAPPPAP